MLKLRRTCLWVGLACAMALGRTDLHAQTLRASDTPTFSFSYPAAVFGEAVIGAVPECPRMDPADIPDGVSPDHTAAAFPGAKPLRKDMFAQCGLPQESPAQIRAIPIAPWRKMYPDAGDRLTALGKMLDVGAVPAGGEIPLVPFLDSRSAFVEHVSFPRFQNGRGVLYVTQWIIEPHLLGDRMMAVYQGVSDDGATYVLGLFPIRTRLPLERFDLKRKESLEKAEARFAPYAAGVAGALRGATDADFTPDLGVIRALMESLRVK
jgi:hypothetical protein